MKLHPGPDSKVPSKKNLSDLNPIQRALQENEDWYRDLVEHSQDLLCIHDLQGRLLSVNPAPARVLGYSVEELLQIPMRDFIAPEFRDQFDAYLLQIAHAGEAQGLMAVMTRAGERRIWEYRNTLRSEGVAAPIVRGIAHDVTEQKRTTALLEASDKRFRAIYDRSPLGIALTETKTGKIMQANPRYCQIVGRSEKDLLGLEFQRITYPDDLATDQENMQKLVAGEARYFELEKRYVRPDGSVRWAKVFAVPMWEPGENPSWHMAMLQDITERKQAETSLREIEARERVRSKELETVLETVPVAVFIARDPACKEMTTNRAGYEQLRLRAGANISQSALAPGERMGFRLLHDGVEVPSEELPMQKAAATSSALYRVPLSLVFDDGTERHTMFNAVPLLGEDGNPTGVVGASIDITELKRAEDAVREREKTQKLILDHLQVGVILSTVGEERTLYQNPKYIELFGYRLEEYPTVNDRWPAAFPDPAYREWMSQEWRRRMAEAARTQGEIEPMELTITCRDGSKKYVRVLARVIGDLNFITFIDLTERKQAEEAWRQSEERFRVALSSAPIKVFNQDRNLRYTWVYNPQDGWTEADYLGRTDEDLFEVEDARRMTKLKKHVLDSGQRAREEIAITVHGKKYYCDFTVEPLLDQAGAIAGVSCACSDITHLRELMDELRVAKERLTEEKLYLEQTIDTELGFGEIVGQSKAMQDVMLQVAKVAPSDSTVLLLGETGTGKELMARAVHSISKRAGNSFIKLNCAAIPSGLLESELFGHEKGAFTGAVARKVGRLELANKGTLFLDEIGEIPLELQPKLLRVLQDQEFERLGGTQTLKVNFRLVAATNRDLRRNVAEKQFRSDLYYRLNVFPIRVPPLRERREDIRPLVGHFLRKYSTRMNRTIASIPTKTMEALEQWDWPGNVRELENFIERSVILTQGSVLQTPLTELAPEKKSSRK
jgi:PAS domain S-box-containing protein